MRDFDFIVPASMHRTARTGVVRSLLLTTGLASGVFFSGQTFADTAGKCGVITYCGGPVLSSVQIVPVFWTSQVSSATTQWAPGYLGSLADSALMDMLSEYSTAGKTGEACAQQTDAGIQYAGPPTATSTNQTISRGTVTQPYTITPAMSGSSIDDSNAAIGAELAAQIKAGKLPPPTYDPQGYPDTLYFVFFPSSVNITLQSLPSCSGGGFLGYHYSAPYTAQVSCKGQYIPYAVIPECSSGSGLAETCSHELAEAVSDTDVGPTEPMTANYGDLGWYLGPTYPCSSPTSCPMNCGEVGDVCQSSGDGQVPGSSVTSQMIWSQAQNGCDVSNPNTMKQAAVPGVMQCMGSGSGGPHGDGGSPGGGSSSSSGGGSSSGGSGGGSGGGGGSNGGGSGGGSSSGASGSSGGASSSGSDSDAGTGPVTTPGSDAGLPMGGNPATGGGGGGCSLTSGPQSATGGIGALGLALAIGLGRRSRRSRRN